MQHVRTGAKRYSKIDVKIGGEILRGSPPRAPLGLPPQTLAGALPQKGRYLGEEHLMIIFLLSKCSFEVALTSL